MDHGFTLKAYEEILIAGLQSGYEFLTFDQIGKEKTPYSCLLRHDIDSELWATHSLSLIEKRLGISSTYFLMTRSTAYNLFCVESLRAVEQLLKDGHSLGLHFMGELTESDSNALIIEKITKEKSWLEKEFGVVVEVVSFHQPSKQILENPITINQLINTYNKAQMRDYFYMSDTNMIWRHVHPQTAFQERIYPRLQLLTHPMWWTETSLSMKEKWSTVFGNNSHVLIKHWKERERSLEAIDLMDLIPNIQNTNIRKGNENFAFTH